MPKFMDIVDAEVERLKADVANLERFFAPIAHSAVKAGLGDLTADAASIAAQVAADPTIVTDAAKRDAVANVLTAKIVAQGKTLGTNEIHAVAAAALAQEKPNA